MKIERKHSSEALAQIQKQFGKGAVMKLGDDSADDEYRGDFDRFYESGSCNRDRRCTREVRIIEVFGPESSGKTTLTLHMIAEAQKTGRQERHSSMQSMHWIRNMREIWASMWMNCWYLSRITANRLSKSAEMLVRSGAMDLVVVDSVAALVPKARDRRCDGRQCGRSAGKTDVAGTCVSWQVVINKTNTTIIFINQLREKSRCHVSETRETTTGGRALKFFSSMRLDVRRIESIKSGDTVLGNRTKSQNRQE